MLAELQAELSTTYALSETPDVRGYLITDRESAAQLGDAALLPGSEETLFVAQQDNELLLSLYLDAALLERLDADNPLEQLHRANLGDYCDVIEGLSHFNCVAYKAGTDRQTSLLELELQAEIDKFVSSLRLAIRQEAPELARSLHGWLFEQVQFRDELDDDASRRYRDANRLAASFCHRIQDTLLSGAPDADQALRTFFRLPIAEKVSQITAMHW